MTEQETEAEVQPLNGVAHNRVRITPPGIEIADQTPEQHGRRDNVDAINVSPEPSTEPFHARARARFQSIATHRHTRMTARQTVYLVTGLHRAGRHVHESRTTVRYDRMMRAAEAAGDHAMALIWEERRAKFLYARHMRRMGRIHAAQRRALAIGIGTGSPSAACSRSASPSRS